MSTELKPVAPRTKADTLLSLTQYCGPALEDNKDRRRLQVTQGARYVNLSKGQARRLAQALMQWADGERPEVSDLEMLAALNGEA